jgi:hypothetical protein
MGRVRAGCALLALIVLLPASAAARALDEMTPRASAPPRAPAQAANLFTHSPSGSFDLAAAVSGIRAPAGGLALDSSGNLYVAVNNASRETEIAVVSPDARLLRRWDPTGGATVGNPTHLAIGPDGLVYLRNRNERIIRVYTGAGTLVRTFGGSLSPNNTGDLELDAAGNVYTIDLDKIVKFNAAGQVLAEFRPLPGIHPDRLQGLAVAADGSLYVAVDTGITGLPVAPPPLLHLDANGGRLPVFDPSLVMRGNYKDVEVANGRLYLLGRLRGPGTTDHTPFGLGVFSPEGRLLDSTASGRFDEGGTFDQLELHGERVFVMGSGVSPGARARSLNQTGTQIGWYDALPLHLPGEKTQNSFYTNCGHGPSDAGSARGTVGVFFTGPPQCPVLLHQSFPTQSGPCRPNFRPTIAEVDVSGRALPPRSSHEGHEVPLYDTYGFGEGLEAFVLVPRNEIRSGKIIVIWRCDHSMLQSYFFAEWKGEIVVHDPSGNVLDRKTSRPVQGATVRLQFSLKQKGPFIEPSVSGFVPQINPQVTSKTGFFGWDVAEGFWRLRITAYGYKPFTSPIYRVPPEVKGLKLMLNQDPRQQGRLIDPYAGRAGKARVGQRLGKRSRGAGLKLRLVRGRLRSVVVRSRGYRTATGVRLGSTEALLLRSYQEAARRATEAARRRMRPPSTYRVGKATFTVRRDRVVGITLGR